MRKIRRNMAKHQLEKEKRRKINRIFASEWKGAYIRNLAESLRKRGYNVQVINKNKGEA